jgi:hypothetical protein
MQREQHPTELNRTSDLILNSFKKVARKTADKWQNQVYSAASRPSERPTAQSANSRSSRGGTKKKRKERKPCSALESTHGISHMANQSSLTPQN